MPAHGRPLSARYVDALNLAAVLHAAQVRKGSRVPYPYLTHLMSVSALVWEGGGGEDGAIAGLLHDAVEDAGGAATLAVIGGRYGARVAAVVAACSEKGTANPGHGIKLPWKERKLAHLEYLRELTDATALLVVTADKLHNCRTLYGDLRRDGAAVFERFNATAVDTVWFYRSMAEVLALRLPGCPLTQDLTQVAVSLASQLPSAN